MVSVCIATYNGGKYIRQQLESILCQLAPEDEVVVSDDGSADDTLEQVRAIGDSRVRIITHSQEITPKFTIDRSTHNFVHAMEHANGDIFFLSDQDDVWLPGKVEKMLAALREYDMVKSDCKVTDGNLNVIEESYCSTHPFSTSIVRNFISGTFTGSCMAFRREVFEAAHPFPKHGVAHDLWLGFIALKKFHVGFVDLPLMLYRRHNETVTESAKGSGTSLWFKLHYRFYIAKALCGLMFR